jgi:hypothetical protein
MTGDVNRLVEHGDLAKVFFEFFTNVVEQAAAKKSVVDLLAEAGIDLDVAKPVRALRQAVRSLLVDAQEAGVIREDVQLAEVMALLTAIGQAALRAGWSRDLQRRTLAAEPGTSWRSSLEQLQGYAGKSETDRDAWSLLWSIETSAAAAARCRRSRSAP